MKRSTITLFALLLTVIVLATGCRGVMHHDVKGSGKRVTQKRDLGTFTTISTEGAFDIEVVCQKDQSVELEGDDNILPLISAEVSGGVLRLRPLKGYSTEDNIVIKINVQNLEGLSASGAGTMQIKGMKNDKFTIEAMGAPSITTSGETNVLAISAKGAGKIDAHSLRATRATIEASGVARIDVNASEQLDVDINGPAHVSYQGDPHVNKSIKGPGTLEKRESSGA